MNDGRAGIPEYTPCLGHFAPGGSIKSDWIGRSTAAAKAFSGTLMVVQSLLVLVSLAALYIERGTSFTTGDLSVHSGMMLSFI